MREWCIALLAGFLTGILSAWGIGGGTLLLLIMTLLLGVGQQTAQTINLLYFIPTALLALREHQKNDFLDRELLRSAIPCGTAAAAAGAWIAAETDTAVLRRPFGIFLLLAAVCIITQKEKESP